MEDRALALGEIAWDVLRRMLREILSRKPGGHLIESSIDRVDLQVLLRLRGADADPKAFSRNLVEEIERILDDAVERAASFRPGHAFCHRCGGLDCEHSEPPTNRHVFLGYGPTGTPRWIDFAQRCLDLRDPEVDRLYEDPPAFLTRVESGKDLCGELLDAFQKERACDLLGQMSAGFFPVRTAEGEGRGIVAVTFQVASSRAAGGRLRLGLNLLGRTPRNEPLSFLWERYDEIPWRKPVLWAQAALQSIEGPAVTSGRARRAPSAHEVEERVEGVLRGLARRIEREQRARSRRTRHAEHRHLSGDRPTRKAVEDARSVTASEVLVDERNGTLVVAGERGRTHFFTPDGRHVSSVRYSKEAVERKRKLGQWREAQGEEARTLLARLGR
jgi:hypothetical protein